MNIVKLFLVWSGLVRVLLYYGMGVAVIFELNIK